MCAGSDSWSSLRFSWLSAFLEGPPFAVRHTSWPANRWALSLGQFGTQVGIGWPLVEQSWGGGQGSEAFYTISSLYSFSELMWLLVVDESEWQAFELEITSPLHQALARPHFAFDQGRDAALRIERKGPVLPLLGVVARRAFTNVGKPLLVRLAGHLGLASSSSSTIVRCVV